MGNINLLHSNWHDQDVDHTYSKSKMLKILSKTGFSTEQSDALLGEVLKHLGVSSCVCCLNEEANYIIKKVGHEEWQLKASLPMIKKLLDTASQKCQFQHDEFQMFIKKL